VQALAGNIIFSSTSQNPSVTNRTITFTLVDGDGSANGGNDTATQGKVVEVFAINDSPLLTLSNEVVTATENQPAVIIAGTSTVTDVDSADYNGGMLFISVTNSELNETLAIRTEGTNAGQINTDGANVRVGTTVIGTFTGGVNEPLQIDFTSAAADLAAVQALLRNITLQVTGDSPTATPREINFLLNDNLGGLVDQTKSVAVVPVNDQPVLTISGGPATFLENSQPVLVAATSTLTDADLGDFNGGTLTVDFQTNGTADDRLELIEQGTAAGEIGLAGSNVTFGGTIFGTLNGGIGLTPLVFTFNTDSSAAAVQALLRRISLENISDAPSPLPRTIRFTFVDGTGGGALTATGTTTANITAVNDPPVVTLSTETVTFTEGGAAVLIANATTVADSDSIDFAGGTLTATITENNTVDDRLEIRDEGTGAGQINLLAGNVRLGTTVIGSFTGGDGTTRGRRRHRCKHSFATSPSGMCRIIRGRRGRCKSP
jgi:hypothetical protein